MEINNWRLAMNIPTYLHKNRIKNQYKILEIFFCICLSLFIILTSIRITLIFKPLYYFDIQYLNIEHQSGFSKDEIIKNYDFIIKYFSNPKVQEFKLPSIPYSRYGQIHFREVKKIFTSIDILIVLIGITILPCIIIHIRHKKFYFLKLTSSILILPPIILSIIFLINFNTSFIIFHKIFFSNDYWQFDPNLDPIIKILPQQFFLHASLLIILLLFLTSIALRILYKRLNIKSIF